MYRIVALVGLFFFSAVIAAEAYTASRHVLTVPYEVMAIEYDVPGQQYLLGELDGYPEMYEFVIDATSTLSVAIRAVPDESEQEPRFSGIVIRDRATRGVEEIARLRAADASWDMMRDPVSKLRYLAGDEYSDEVAPGTYRVEVSTPDNTGKYILVIGTTDRSPSYFTTLGSVADTYSFYGVSKIAMVRAPVVLYPLGILFLLGLIFLTWRYKGRIHA